MRNAKNYIKTHIDKLYSNYKKATPKAQDHNIHIKTFITKKKKACQIKSEQDVQDNSSHKM